MLTLKFHKFKDKQPKIGDDIIYLRVGHNFYCDTLEFKECTVEADWMVFEDGCYSGTSFRAERGEKCPEDYIEYGKHITHSLQLMFDGWYPEDNHMWALSKNVWKSFDKALEEK